MSSNDPEDDPPIAPQDLFPFDEMSTGETSSLVRRAQVVTGAPDRPVAQQPELKPMTGAQLAFRPSAPPRSTPSNGSTGVQSAFKPGAAQKPATGTQPAFKPSSGQQPALKPTTGTQPPYRPGTGTQPAFRPSAPPASGKTGTSQFAQFKPSAPPAEAPAPEHEEEPPVFDAERLQAQFRALSLTDSALGRAAKGAPKPSKLPASAVEDTFVKRKMKQAEEKVVDLDLDEDLG